MVGLYSTRRRSNNAELNRQPPSSALSHAKLWYAYPPTPMFTNRTNRRRFLKLCGSIAAMSACPLIGMGQESKPALRTRGVVLLPEDLSLVDWPPRAHQAG